MRMNEDGSDQRPVSDLAIMQLQTVSPQGRWAVVGMTPPASHGDKNTMAAVVPIDGGPAIPVCLNCTFGYGIVRFASPFMAWSGDERTVFVSLRYFGLGTGKIVAMSDLARNSTTGFPQRTPKR